MGSYVPGLLRINALKQRARLGCSEEERSYPQLISLDLELELDIASCAVSDSLVDTVDYLKVVEVVEALLSEHNWKLVEKMSFDLAGQILSRFPRLKSVQVTVTKQVTDNAHGFSTVAKMQRNLSPQIK